MKTELEKRQKNRSVITEDFVSTETQEMLNAKDFQFNSDSVEVIGEYTVKYKQRQVSGLVKCCTIQTAMKWLREVHDIFITIRRAISGNGYVYYHEIYNGGIAKYAQYGKTYSTYEEACQSAIIYCLEKLIKL